MEVGSRVGGVRLNKEHGYTLTSLSLQPQTGTPLYTKMKKMNKHLYSLPCIPTRHQHIVRECSQIYIRYGSIAKQILCTHIYMQHLRTHARTHTHVRTHVRTHIYIRMFTRDDRNCGQSFIHSYTHIHYTKSSSTLLLFQTRPPIAVCMHVCTTVLSTLTHCA